MLQPWLVTLLHLIPITSALGINCRGSGLCPRASWNNQNSVSVIQVLRDVVWASSKSNDTTYASGDHIICLSQSQTITVSAGPEIDGVSVGGTISGSGSIAEGGICLFPQGASLTLGQIRPLVDAILDHKCTTCGSVPIHFVDEGSNDPSPGILTFNYVAAPTCDRDCISDTGSLPSTGSQASQEPSSQPQSIPPPANSNVPPSQGTQVSIVTVAQGGGQGTDVPNNPNSNVQSTTPVVPVTTGQGSSTTYGPKPPTEPITVIQGGPATSSTTQQSVVAASTTTNAPDGAAASTTTEAPGTAASEPPVVTVTPATATQPKTVTEMPPMTVTEGGASAAATTSGSTQPSVVTVSNSQSGTPSASSNFADRQISRMQFFVLWVLLLSALPGLL